MFKQRVLDYVLLHPGSMAYQIAIGMGEPYGPHNIVDSSRVEQALRELEREGKVEKVGQMWFPRNR